MRKAYFGKEDGLLEVPVLAMEEIGPTPTEGPVLIDTYDTTIVIPPRCTVRSSSGGSLVIDIA
jgi:N-methylhydantoinase A